MQYSLKQKTPVVMGVPTLNYLMISQSSAFDFQHLAAVTLVNSHERSKDVKSFSQESTSTFDHIINLCESDSGQMYNMYCVFPINSPPPSSLTL